jgi:hypothetical protein
MGRTCSTCTDPRREEIDRRLTDGEDDAAVARAFGLTQTAVFRHRAKHLKLRKTNHLTPQGTVIRQAVPVPAETTPKTAALPPTTVVTPPPSTGLPAVEDFSTSYAGIAQRLDKIITNAEACGKASVAIAGLREFRATLDSHSRLAGHDKPTTVQVSVDITVSAAVHAVLTTLGALPPTERILELEKLVDAEPTDAR